MVNAAGICSLRAEDTLAQHSVSAGESAAQWLRVGAETGNRSLLEKLEIDI